ncbi:hypothetical protein [Streptomyces sp. NPDC051561]
MILGTGGIKNCTCGQKQTTMTSTKARTTALITPVEQDAQNEAKAFA